MSVVINALKIECYLSSKVTTTITLPDSFYNLQRAIEIAYSTILSKSQFEIMYRTTKNSKSEDQLISDEGVYKSFLADLSSSDSCVFYLLITLPLYSIAKKGKRSIKKLPRTNTSVLYSSIAGFDDTFEELLFLAVQESLDELDPTVKSASDVRRSLTNQSYTKTDTLIEENLLKSKLFCILLQPTRAYSSVNIKDIEKMIALPLQYSDINAFLVDVSAGTPSSSALNTIVNDSNLQIPSFDTKVTYTKQGLTYISNCVQPAIVYNEAIRRIIIDCILLPALSHDEKNGNVDLMAEYNMELSEEVQRVGKGPLDYYISSHIPVITASVKDPTVLEEEDTMEAIEDSELASEISRTVLEAKKLLEKGDLAQGLGQLVAQLLDGLYLEETRKRDTEGMIKKGNGVRCIKGILSTGHHTLFFSLLKTDGLPVLQFYGRYAVDVLPKSPPPRESGLGVGEQVKQEQVEKVLKAVHSFVNKMSVVE